MMGSALAAAALALELADAPGRGEAVHDRHLAVHQHRVEGGFGDALQGLGAVVGEGDIRRQLLQQALRDALIHRIVFHQQDAMAAEGGTRLRRGRELASCAALCQSAPACQQRGQRRGADGFESRRHPGGACRSAASCSAPNRDSRMNGSLA